MISLKCCQCGKFLGHVSNVSLVEGAKHICTDCLKDMEEALKKYIGPPTDEDSLMGDIIFRQYLKEKMKKAA